MRKLNIKWLKLQLLIQEQQFIIHQPLDGVEEEDLWNIQWSELLQKQIYPS
jgi:hypothetical protein